MEMSSIVTTALKGLTTLPVLGFAIETSNVSGASVVTSEFIFTVASAEGAFELNCTRVVVGG